MSPHLTTALALALALGAGLSCDQKAPTETRAPAGPAGAASENEARTQEDILPMAIALPVNQNVSTVAPAPGFRVNQTGTGPDGIFLMAARGSCLDHEIRREAPMQLSGPLIPLAFCLALAGRILAQQPADDPQGRTLIGLRNFAVHARVQLSQGAVLPAIDEHRLRGKLEQAVRSEGMSIVGSNDVRDGPGAHLALLYMVIETRDGSGQETGFAAMSCIQAEQTVSITRLGRYVYAVVPTWRSCGIVAGDTASYGRIIERNAEQQIVRFLEAWRTVNPPRPAPSLQSRAELGLGASSRH